MSSNPDLNQDFDPSSDHRDPPYQTDSASLSNADPVAYRDSSAVDSPQSQRLSNSFARAVQPLSPKTAANYRRIFYSLVSRASSLLDLAPDTVSVADLIEQLHSDPTIKVDSKRTYRAAIAWALRQPDIEFSQAAREEGLALVAAYDPRDGVEQEMVRNTRVSARAIPHEDLGPLLNSLLGARLTQQAWATKTTSWLNAGIATGARPGEWKSAHWFDRDRRILRLPNAKLKKQAPFRWQHIPERLLNRADADLATMAEADFDNISIVVAAAKRHSDLLARNLAFFDQAEAGTDASNADAIETLRRLRAWELHNAGLAWRDIEVPVRWVGAVDAHLTNLQQYLSSVPGKHGPPTFERYYDGCRTALRTACLSAFPGCTRFTLRHQVDCRGQHAGNHRRRSGSRGHGSLHEAQAHDQGELRGSRPGVPWRRSFRAGPWPTPETNATKQPTGQRITRVRRMSVGWAESPQRPPEMGRQPDDSCGGARRPGPGPAPAWASPGNLIASIRP